MLQKALSKNPNDVRALYFYSKFYLQDNNPEKDFEKAYYNATNAEDALEKIQVSKEKDKLAKEGINASSLKENRLTVCMLALENINKNPSINQYDEYLRKYYLAEQYYQQAIVKRDSVAFYIAEQSNTEKAYQGFLDKYLGSALRDSAITKRDKLAYDKAIGGNSIESYGRFLSKYPESNLVGPVKIKRDSAAFSLAEKANNEESYRDFIEKYPDANQVEIAKTKLDDISFQNTVKDSSLNSIEWYINNHSTGKHVSEAEVVKQKIVLKLQKRAVDSANTSRVLKTYSGAFGGGTATYQYYENEKFERIYHGSFYFTSNEYNTNGGGKCTEIVKGQFKNNQKDGSWMFVNTSERFGGEILTTTGQYLEGHKIGLWIFKEQSKSKKILIQSSVFFKDEKFVGIYKIFIGPSLAPYGKPVDFVCSFNNDGFFDGDWKLVVGIIDGSQKEDIRKYKNGVLCWRLCRDMSTGKIYDRFDSTKFTDLFFHNYDTISQSALINDTPYHIINTSEYSQMALKIHNHEGDISYDLIGDFAGGYREVHKHYEHPYEWGFREESEMVINFWRKHDWGFMEDSNWGEDKLKKNKKEYNRMRAFSLPEDSKLYIVIDENEMERKHPYTCFVQGTLVHAKQGFVPIESLKMEDSVFTYNIEKNKTELCKIQKTFVRNTSKIYQIMTDNQTIMVTAEHPFYVENKGWVLVKSLKPGDRFKTMTREGTEQIKTIHQIKEALKVYNIEVDGNHNYFVTKGDILVHNKYMTGSEQ